MTLSVTESKESNLTSSPWLWRFGAREKHGPSVTAWRQACPRIAPPLLRKLFGFCQVAGPPGSASWFTSILHSLPESYPDSAAHGRGGVTWLGPGRYILLDISQSCIALLNFPWQSHCSRYPPFIRHSSFDPTTKSKEDKPVAQRASKRVSLTVAQ